MALPYHADGDSNIYRLDADNLLPTATGIASLEIIWPNSPRSVKGVVLPSTAEVQKYGGEAPTFIYDGDYIGPDISLPKVLDGLKGAAYRRHSGFMIRLGQSADITADEAEILRNFGLTVHIEHVEPPDLDESTGYGQYL